MGQGDPVGEVAAVRFYGKGLFPVLGSRTVFFQGPSDIGPVVKNPGVVFGGKVNGFGGHFFSMGVFSLVDQGLD